MYATQERLGFADSVNVNEQLENRKARSQEVNAAV